LFVGSALAYPTLPFYVTFAAILVFLMGWGISLLGQRSIRNSILTELEA
jgi:hypothetical protein